MECRKEDRQIGIETLVGVPLQSLAGLLIGLQNRGEGSVLVQLACLVIC